MFATAELDKFAGTAGIAGRRIDLPTRSTVL
jgi:hypothetical protein